MERYKKLFKESKDLVYYYDDYEIFPQKNGIAKIYRNNREIPWHKIPEMDQDGIIDVLNANQSDDWESDRRYLINM